MPRRPTYPGISTRYDRLVFRPSTSCLIRIWKGFCVHTTKSIENAGIRYCAGKM